MCKTYSYEMPPAVTLRFVKISKINKKNSWSFDKQIQKYFTVGQYLTLTIIYRKLYNINNLQ